MSRDLRRRANALLEDCEMTGDRDCTAAVLVRDLLVAACFEICICAAIRLADGRVIRSHRHSHAMRTAFDMRIPTVDIRAAEQGFVTSHNRYVGREEGLQLQLAAGLPSADPGGYRGDLLFSEDLY